MFTHVFTKDEFAAVASIVLGVQGQQPDARPPEVGKMARSIVQNMEATDPLFPRGVDDRVAQEGWRQFVMAVEKQGDFSAIRVGDKIICISSKRSVRRRNAEGDRERFYQPTLWWELTWGEFEDMLGQLRGQRDRLSTEIRGFSRALLWKEKHPDTKTPGEALEREGIDPRNFTMDEAA